MQKKTEIQELDIPVDDIDCWERYPKHRWVYDLSRLLDAQHIKWSPYERQDLPNRELNMKLTSKSALLRQPGYIYINFPEGDHLLTEVYLTKGEIKFMRHLNPVTGKETSSLVGELELRINAFVTLHFQKFSGVITAETYGNEIYGMALRPHSELALEANAEVLKHVKRIYKKNDTLSVNGPTGQVFLELLAS